MIEKVFTNSLKLTLLKQNTIINKAIYNIRQFTSRKYRKEIVSKVKISDLPKLK